MRLIIRIIAHTLIVLFSTISTYSQNITQTNSISTQNSLINPANINLDEFSMFVFSRQQFGSHYDNNLINYYIGGNNIIQNSKQNAFGAIGGLNREAYMNSIMAKGVYAYRIEINNSYENDHNISIGFSTGLTQYRLDAEKAKTKILLSSSELNKLNEEYSNKTYFNIGFGINYNLKGFNINFASLSLLDEKLDDRIKLKIIDKRLKHVAEGSYKVRLSEDINISPFLMWSEFTDKSQTIVTKLEAEIYRTFSFRIGYNFDNNNNNNSLLLSTSYKHGDYTLGYNIEKFVDGQNKNSYIHEIQLRYCINSNT